MSKKYDAILQDDQFYFDLDQYDRDQKETIQLLDKANTLKEIILSEQPHGLIGEEVSRFLEKKTSAMEEYRRLTQQHGGTLYFFYQHEQTLRREKENLSGLISELKKVQSRIDSGKKSLTAAESANTPGQVIQSAAFLASIMAVAGVLFTLLVCFTVPPLAAVVVSSVATYLLTLGAVAALSFTATLLGTLIPIWRRSKQNVQGSYHNLIECTTKQTEIENQITLHQEIMICTKREMNDLEATMSDCEDASITDNSSRRSQQLEHNQRASNGSFFNEPINSQSTDEPMLSENLNQALH